MSAGPIGEFGVRKRGADDKDDSAVGPNLASPIGPAAAS